MTPPIYIDGKFPLTVTTLEATVGIQAPYIQQASGAASLSVPNPTNADTLCVLTQAQTLDSKTLLQPVISTAVMTSPDVTGGTFSGITLLTADIPSGIPASSIMPLSVSDTEFGYINGLTSTAQTQLDNMLLATNKATAAVQTAATSSSYYVTPFAQPYNPSASKAWVSFLGTSAGILTSYNISAVARNALGDYTVSFSSAFSSTDYCMFMATQAEPNTAGICAYTGKAVDSVGVLTYNDTGSANTDHVRVDVVFFGTMA